MDDSEALERVAKMRAKKEAERVQREGDKKEFMRPRHDLDYMLRESRAKMNFMKRNQNVMTIPGSPEWHSVKRAASLHGNFEYHLRKHREAETYYLASLRTDDKDIIGEYKTASDNHLKECTFNWYAVGYLYNQFLVGAERMAGKHG